MLYEASMDRHSIVEDVRHGVFYVQETDDLGAWISRRNFKTREQAEAKLAEIAALPKCRECGEPQEVEYIEPTRSRLLANGLCFTCDHWHGYIARVADPACIRINGQHYIAGSEPRPGVPSHCYGFGGALHEIAFADGRILTTRNLWTQGRIPKRFRERLPDNATFFATPAEQVSP